MTADFFKKVELKCMSYSDLWPTFLLKIKNCILILTSKINYQEGCSQIPLAVTLIFKAITEEKLQKCFHEVTLRMAIKKNSHQSSNVLNILTVSVVKYLRKQRQSKYAAQVAIKFVCFFLSYVNEATGWFQISGATHLTACLISDRKYRCHYNISI